MILLATTQAPGGAQSTSSATDSAVINSGNNNIISTGGGSSGTGGGITAQGGAGGGALAGNAINENMNSNSSGNYQQRCEWVPGQTQRVITGYQVTLQYKNRMFHTETNREYVRGQQVPVTVNVDVAQ